MKDIALALAIFATLPLAIRHPWIGVLSWTWVSIMNPHTLSYGWAYSFPWAQLVAISIFLGLFFSRDPKRLPINAITGTMIAFVLWMLLTSLFALYPDKIGEQFSKVMKVQLMLFITLLVITTRKQVHLLVWVATMSVAFWGVKGGIFAIRTAGSERVWGPTGGFFAENNSLGVAIIIVIPLLVYLYKHTVNKWIKRGLIASVFFCTAAVFGTQSRGAFLAVAAMGFVLWLRMKQKWTIIPIAALLVGLTIFMPDKWTDRMSTIKEYDEDESAMGRINAWSMAWGLAGDRLFGGGFYVFTQELFDKYSLDPSDGVRAAHSIYFQVLGEHGYPGLMLFLLIWFFIWRSAAWIRRNTQKRDDLAWAFDLSSMIQVSLAGYLVGGAFLSLAYFDLPYLLGIVIVITRLLVEEQLKQGKPALAPTTPQPSADAADPALPLKPKPRPRLRMRSADEMKPR